MYSSRFHNGERNFSVPPSTGRHACPAKHRIYRNGHSLSADAASRIWKFAYLSSFTPLHPSAAGASRRSMHLNKPRTLSRKAAITDTGDSATTYRLWTESKLPSGRCVTNVREINKLQRPLQAAYLNRRQCRMVRYEKASASAAATRWRSEWISMPFNPTNHILLRNRQRRFRWPNYVIT